MLMKVIALAEGFSGVRLELVETLCALINKGIYPRIPSRGSVGASGDLAPLAHMALPLIGFGEVHCQGRVITGKQALKKLGRAPLELVEKEGLALINQVLAENPNLIQWQYINQLGDQVELVIIPSNTPFLFDLEQLLENAGAQQVDSFDVPTPAPSTEGDDN